MSRREHRSIIPLQYGPMVELDGHLRLYPRGIDHRMQGLSNKYLDLQDSNRLRGISPNYNIAKVINILQRTVVNACGPRVDNLKLDLRIVDNYDDPTLLERTICNEKRSASIDDNISSSTDTSQKMLTDTSNPSTYSLRAENGDLHDQESHLQNAAGKRLDDQRATDTERKHRPMETDEHRSIPAVEHQSTESVASCETVRILTHEVFTAKHPHPPKLFRIKDIN
ncbi:hypothetical protein F2Q68_00015319 [Brassica cretica]|uniref:Uncharacterized protein n=1 Tax=Brassica cretica TaxID=69181 RepID=A0A8S9HJL1_BRACR|nr:hypothetical protein F2Q68_00015319 [Brassica cretica]